LCKTCKPSFTGTARKVSAFDLSGMAGPENLDKFRLLFTDTDSLQPGLTTPSVSDQASQKFGLVADGLIQRGGASSPIAAAAGGPG
jgi:hypothetical protein